MPARRRRRAGIPAFRTTLTSTVAASGTAASGQQVTLTFGSSGKIQEFLVELGDAGEAGQALARIEDSQFKQAVQSAEASLASAQARLNVVFGGSTATELSAAQQSVASAQSQVASSQRNLDDLLLQPTPADIANAQQGILTAQNAIQNAVDAQTRARNDLDAAQDAFRTAEDELDDEHDDLRFAHDELEDAIDDCDPDPSVSVPSLPSQGRTASGVTVSAFAECDPISDAALTALDRAAGNYNAAVSSYNAAITALASKEAVLAEAESTIDGGNLERSIESAQLGLLEAQQRELETLLGPGAGEIEAARRSLESAQASLRSAEARLAELFEPAAPDVYLPLQAAVEQARANVEDARKDLDDTTIVAPFGGQISQIASEVGAQVSASAAVFILLDPELIRIDATVDQSDISDLAVGQAAEVSFDALADATYRATVMSIGLTPSTSQGIVSYDVALAVDTAGAADGAPLPAPGMTASVTITTSRVEAALVVSSQALQSRGQSQSVVVRTAAGDEVRPVTTGVTEGLLTQVLDGLEEGAEVLVGASSATTDATRTQQPAGGGGGRGGGGGFGGAP